MGRYSDTFWTREEAARELLVLTGAQSEDDFADWSGLCEVMIQPVRVWDERYRILALDEDAFGRLVERYAEGGA